MSKKRQREKVFIRVGYNNIHSVQAYVYRGKATMYVHRSIHSNNLRYTITDGFSGQAIGMTNNFQQASRFAREVCKLDFWIRVYGKRNYIRIGEMNKIKSLFITFLSCKPELFKNRFLF